MNYDLELFTQKENLSVCNKHLNDLNSRLVNDSNNEHLKQIIQMRETEIEEIKKKIAVLEKIIKLDSDYKNQNPIFFHYVDTDGSIDDIELSSKDVNYSRAYGQQRKLLELEYNYMNRKPLNYSGMEVSFGDENYDKIYNLAKDDVLKIPAVDRIVQGKSVDLVNQNAVEQKLDASSTQIDSAQLGIQSFAPNNLDSEYAVFKKDGYLNIVGNFTSDWLNDNFYKLDSNLVNDNDVNKIKIWNNLKYGSTPLKGLEDVKVVLSEDGTIKIEGDIDAIDYHHSTLKVTKEEENSVKHFNQEKSDKDKEITSIVKVEPDKDYSGLDKIPNDSDSLSHGSEGMEPAVPGKLAKSKSAKPSLIQRAKTILGNLKSWQKVAIVAGAIAVVGAGVIIIGPHIMEAINNLLNPEQANNVSNTLNTTVSNVVNKVGTVTNSAATTPASVSLDYSSVGGAGHTVFTNAGDAVSNANGVVSNQWFSNNPVDVFNTATNSYMGLTPEQLADPKLMAQLAQDPNNTMLFGNSISNPSGFMGLDDVVSTMTKVR